MNADIDAKLIEEGRRLFAGEWKFIWASPSIETLPPMAGMEVAFAGRSNVGKSSLINALTGRNALARTSHTPGRTQELIFFDGPDKAGHDVSREIGTAADGVGRRHVFSAAFLANTALRLSISSTFTPFLCMM